MLSLASPLHHLPGIGPILSKRLNKLELKTIQDLLLHFPTRYEDFSRTIPISQLKIGEQVTIRGKIKLISSRRAFKRRLNITELLVSDGTGTIKAIWFNQAYLTKTLKTNQPIILAGKLINSPYGLQLEHPTYELPIRKGVHTGRLVPIYPLTANLGQFTLRAIIARILPMVNQLTDWLPNDIRNQFNLPSFKDTVKILHQPPDTKDLILARQRITFNELYLLHLKAKLARLQLQQAPAPPIPFSPLIKSFVSNLPWTLTPDQKISAWEIIKDLEKPNPMFRLLQGDVGSGKTIVAGIAALNTATAGWQVAFLAPTEILAKQHFNTLKQLFKKSDVAVGLFTKGHQTLAHTNKLKELTATSIKKYLAQGKINIIIGTHTILQSNIKFHNLGLIIVDEQHRFGVEQRQLLTKNHELTPHLLSLSATPIPRSLALTIFGDLDLSVIKNLPLGRKPITTNIIESSKRQNAYNLMRREVNAGHRVFIVCPLIDESDSLGVRAVTTEHTRLSQEIFPDIKLGLLHGKLSSKEKNKVMENFKSGLTPILISTSVIEVGVDVPEATVMAIEGAERFGIAQLHQFRGRVGRSDKPSYCLLFSDNTNPQALKRLQAVVKYANGFDLAEFDLKSRGPGDFLGSTQAGWFKLQFAELANKNLLDTVRQAVKYTLEIDSELTTWPELKNKIDKLEFHPE